TAPRVLPSFPTRRSSDLERLGMSEGGEPAHTGGQQNSGQTGAMSGTIRGASPSDGGSTHNQTPPSWKSTHNRPPFEPASSEHDRSEEHTSELQSRENLVC